MSKINKRNMRIMNEIKFDFYKFTYFYSFIFRKNVIILEKTKKYLKK